MYIPDIFELIVDRAELPSLTIEQIETAFGRTDEEYLIADSKIIAQVCPVEAYHQKFGVEKENCIVLNFLKLPFGNLTIELDSVAHLFDRLNSAKLIYELDCDQHEIQKLIAEDYSLNNLINYSLKPVHSKFNAFILEKK